MSVSSYRFIDPRTLVAIADLQLIARTVVDGFMLGTHQSPRAGAGLEFSQYRSYQAGDDLRRVDWKMYGRSDRYFVRESEVESSIAVRFVLDTSASMAHEDSGLTKFDYARFLVAALGYLAHGQDDAIGLYALSDRGIKHLPPKLGQQHLHRFLHELERLQPAGKWPGWQTIASLYAATPKREMTILVSDMHEDDDEIRDVLAKISSLKNEVLLCHLLGRNEVDFSYEGFLTFEDLESGKTLPVDTTQARPQYLAAFQQKTAALRREMHDQHIAYDRFVMDAPLDFALRRYLVRRAKML